MPPILFCWPTTSEAVGGGMAVEVKSFHQYPITFCYCAQKAEEGCSDKMLSKMEVRMKHSCVIEFLRLEKKKKPAHIDIHCCLLNIYGGLTVDVSTVMWVVHFSYGNNDSGHNHKCLWTQYAALVLCWWQCTADGGDNAEK